MKRLILLLTLIILTVSCQNEVDQNNSFNKFEEVLQNSSLKVASNIDELIIDIQKSTNFSVEKIIDLKYNTSTDGTEIINVFFETDGNEKNILYIKTNKEVIVDGIVNMVKEDFQTKNMAPATKAWCDDCDGCYVKFNMNTQVLSCSASCCALYIE